MFLFYMSQSAAFKIQQLFRRIMTRKLLNKKKMAATRIQKRFRGNTARSSLFKSRSVRRPSLTSFSQAIQSNFSIKLNDIPLLKKFSSPEIFKNLVQRFMRFHETRFILTINENYVEICPYCDGNQALFEGADYDLLKMFITYQLINSGILPFLREIPLASTSKYDTSIGLFFTIIPINNWTSLAFHNDGYLFNILRYETPDNRPVLGSEILLIDQRFALSHPKMGTGRTDEPNKVTKSDGNYDIAYAGELLSLTQAEILQMYDTDKVKAVTMRGLYNSGDSLVMNDMLVKHAAVSDENNSIISLEHIDLEDFDEPNIKYIEVTVCKKKILQTEKELNDRGILHMAIHKQKILHNSKFVRLDSHAFIVPIESQPPNDLNFDINDYSNFLKTLEMHNNMCGSFTISSGGISQSFLNRGGKRKKFKIRK